jgi:hypothetical protein
MQPTVTEEGSVYKRPRFMRELLVEILAGLIAGLLLATLVGSCSIHFTLQTKGTGGVARPTLAGEKGGESATEEEGPDSLVRGQ